MLVLLVDEALSSLGSLISLGWNALAKACPFDLGSLCVGSVSLWPVSPGSWPGGAWVPWRALPWSCCGCLFVASGDLRS